MWLYFWPHVVYHTLHLLPRKHRLKLRIVLILLTLSILAPQFYALFSKKSSRACEQRLFPILVASICFTYVTIGFTLLLSIVDSLPRDLKISFHIYGVAAFVFGVVQSALTLHNNECISSTPELYWMNYALSVASICSSVFVLILTPFWIVNNFRPGSFLSWEQKKGFCYRGVNCCRCLWYVTELGHVHPYSAMRVNQDGTLNRMA